MADFTLKPVTASAAHNRAIQNRIHAAHGRILNVVQIIGDHKTARDDEKVQYLEDFAEIGEAYVRGEVTVPATTPSVPPARGALGTGPGTTPPPATSNPADLLRIKELENALVDAANVWGFSIKMTSGKYDEVEFVTDAKRTADDLKKKATTPPAPADMVPKAEVAADVTQIEDKMSKLSVNVLKGNRIQGLDDLKTEVAKLRKLAPSTPATP